jgi:two-component system, NtrC family, response regulator GlrR
MNRGSVRTICLLGTTVNLPLAAEIERILKQDAYGISGPVSTVALEELDSSAAADLVRATKAGLVLLFLPPDLDRARRVLRVLQEAAICCPIIGVLSEPPLDSLNDLFKGGISDFVIAPVRPLEFWLRIERYAPSKGERTPDSEPLSNEHFGFERIVGQSPSLRAELDRLLQVRECSATVLITGETGSGKELFARAVHDLSPRASGPFVAVNCGAIPTDLLENEFFGHGRGAFTGANSEEYGVVQKSDKGSLFLDEIDALPPSMQVKLLRFLQEKEYRPLGTAQTLKSDSRVIVASNASLTDAVRTGKFRSDLYYRVNVLAFHLPPLRQRREDIPLLAQHFLQKYASEHCRPARKLTTDAEERLLSYTWPGNIRELENVIQRAVLICGNETVDAGTIGVPGSKEIICGNSFRERKARAIEEFELSYLTALLHRHQGNISAAARSAQKNRRAFWELLRKHRLKVQAQQDSSAELRTF